jgi:hypothetical protein
MKHLKLFWRILVKTVPLPMVINVVLIVVFIGFFPFPIQLFPLLPLLPIGVWIALWICLLRPYFLLEYRIEKRAEKETNVFYQGKDVPISRKKMFKKILVEHFRKLFN